MRCLWVCLVLEVKGFHEFRSGTVYSHSIYIAGLIEKIGRNGEFSPIAALGGKLLVEIGG